MGNEMPTAIQQEVEQKETIEEKIAHTLNFMQGSINREGAPNFKAFWEARKLCLELFKDKTIGFAYRSHLWEQYLELSKEAYKLKEVLDEQSAFAAEQIELAIQSFEEELEIIGDSLQNQAPVNIQSKVLRHRNQFYGDCQRELGLLNVYAQRVNSLRKELIKTPMRIRIKNQFFQRLSAAGDHIFPRRKDLVREVSGAFKKDVQEFVANHFGVDIDVPLFVLREDIKALQGVAKTLTLNTQAFNETRKALSECWDKVKKLEKERKKEKNKARAELKERLADVEEKINALVAEFETLSLTDIDLKLTEIEQLVKEKGLSADDEKMALSRVVPLRKQANDKRQTERQLQIQQQHELKQKKREEFIAKKEELLKKLDSSMTVADLDKMREAFLDDVDELGIGKTDRLEADRLLKKVEDKVADVRLSSLSAGERQNLEGLKSLLDVNFERRTEIRKTLEEYRKASGASGLDIEQAMKQQELIDEEKVRLKKVEESIAKLEKDIQSLGV